MDRDHAVYHMLSEKVNTSRQRPGDVDFSKWGG